MKRIFNPANYLPRGKMGKVGRYLGQRLRPSRHKDEEELLGLGAVGIVHHQAAREARLHALRGDHLHLEQGTVA